MIVCSCWFNKACSMDNSMFDSYINSQKFRRDKLSDEKVSEGLKVNEGFIELCNSNSLSKINFPTRKNSLLDLLFTNQPDLLVSCEPVTGFGDHDIAALTNINCHSQRLKTNTKESILLEQS